MYKTLIFVTIALCLCGCSYNIDIYGNYETLADLNSFVNRNIDYLLEDGGDYFQSPKEMAELKTGDCEDYVVLFMALANRDLNITPEMQIVYIEGNGNHAISYYDDTYYDPTNNCIFNNLPKKWHPIIRWDYNIIMCYATGFYTKGIYE